MGNDPKTRYYQRRFQCCGVVELRRGYLEGHRSPRLVGGRLGGGGRCSRFSRPPTRICYGVSRTMNPSSSWPDNSPAVTNSYMSLAGIYPFIESHGVHENSDRICFPLSAHVSALSPSINSPRSDCDTIPQIRHQSFAMFTFIHWFF